MQSFGHQSYVREASLRFGVVFELGRLLECRLFEQINRKFVALTCSIWFIAIPNSSAGIRSMTKNERTFDVDSWKGCKDDLN